MEGILLPNKKTLRQEALEEERLKKNVLEAQAALEKEQSRHIKGRKHNCSICQHPKRELIEQWRDGHDNLSFRNLQKRCEDELGFKVSLDTLNRHFKYREVKVAVVRETTAEDIARREAKTAMEVFVENYSKASKMLETLVDKKGHLLEPKHATYVSLLLRERRESALALLRFTPGDPDKKVADAAQDWVSLMKEARRNSPPQVELLDANPIDVPFTVDDDEAEEEEDEL